MGYLRTFTAAVALTGAIAFAPAAARAQAQSRYAARPTAGVSLPTTGLAGEHDALSVSTNPAGLWFLGGWHLALALDTSEPDQEDATSAGPGFGVFAAGALG